MAMCWGGLTPRRAEADRVNAAVAEYLPLFWQKSPEMLATKVAAVLAPPKAKKEVKTEE